MAVSTVSLRNDSGSPFRTSIRDVNHILALLLWHLTTFLDDSRYLLLVLFGHSAHDRLVAEVYISVVQSFSLDSSEALVQLGLLSLAIEVPCIEYEVLSSQQLSRGSRPGRGLL